MKFPYSTIAVEQMFLRNSNPLITWSIGAVSLSKSLAKNSLNPSEISPNTVLLFSY